MTINIKQWFFIVNLRHTMLIFLIVLVILQSRTYHFVKPDVQKFINFINNYQVNAQNGLVSNILHLKNRSDKDIDVDFSMYTPNNSRINLKDIESRDIDNIAPFKFIIHGWKESPSRQYFKTMTEAYFQRGNYNVVHVNWSIPADRDYTNAVGNIVPVGTIVAEFILRICDVSPITLKDIHILGHSLGAHVAGVAGHHVIQKTGNKVARITGLDPAGPLFEGFPRDADKQLNKNQGEMVDIVHTDGGFFGIKKSIGTVDFFPNGGSALQPGCVPLVSDNILDIVDNPVDYAFCSHKKSHTYYIESIRSDIMAVKCDSWMDYEKKLCDENDVIPFGENTPSDARGNYYFRINSPTK